MKPHFESFSSNYMAGCQQPFLSKLAGDNRLSAAVFGPKRLVTTGCQQPSPFEKEAGGGGRVAFIRAGVFIRIKRVHALRSYRKNSKIWDTSNNCHNCPKNRKV